jgi:hypothetical protein
VVRAINGGEEWERERDKPVPTRPRLCSACVHHSREQHFDFAAPQAAVHGPHASRSTFSSSSRLLCSWEPSSSTHIAFMPGHIFDSAGRREECTSARGGRLTHALGSGSECDGLTAKHRHTHALELPVGELALKADQSCTTREAAAT